ncbi:leucine-rich repeat flightless-interacting protein 1 isoform 3-T3 [Leptodactylus fuscus]|uniref:leucine-rich repeat flightless-interacting protein 1 isoform X3 n=1 Tax=Leptodactylus fuscus TaxID=238119 RepID=UPI003F4EEB46
MGTQGPGRKRHPNREKLSAEDHALNQIAREAEARLAAKRAARAEAREIRMKELERQQKEIYQVQKKYYGLDTKWGDIEQWMASDEDDMSVTSRSSLRTNGYEDELLGATQYRKSSRSSTGSGDTVPFSRGPPRDEAMPSLLNCNSLPSRSQRGSLYDEGVTSGSRRSSSSRPPSEYSCYLGSGSRASSRASSARASPVSSEPTGPPLFRRGSTSGSVHSQGHLEDLSAPSISRIEERPDKDFADKSNRPVSSLSAATLASLGGTSSRRGSGDTSISVDTEASIREIKEISELKEQIEDVEGKYMQGLKEMKDSLAEVEEKYKRSMVTNAQLDNEKTSLQYQVDTLREVLLELEEELAESRRQYEDKQKECERHKHDHTVLRFQLAEMKEALEQREALMTEIRQLQQRQEVNDREICDLKETIEWKDKKIGALERQKEFFDPVRSERDALREEVTQMREVLKKHGIALDSDGTLNGDTSIDNHVNSDGPPDPPIRAVSMGKTEVTMEKKETVSVVGECPPSRIEQDRQEVAQDAEDRDVTSEHKETEDARNKIVEREPVDVCSDEKSETNMDEQQEETSCKVREDKQDKSHTDVSEDVSEVGGETTLKRSDISPSGSEVFQDAIDFVDETPSTSEIDEDVTGCESEKEETKNSQQENITEADDLHTIDGPEQVAGTPVTLCKDEESKSSSPEDRSTELAEKITSNENLDLGHQVLAEEKIQPQQSQQEESQAQNKISEMFSAAESADIDQSNIISEPEQASQDAPVTSDDLVTQEESYSENILDVPEPCSVTKRSSITEDEAIKDHVIPEEKYKAVPEEERQEVASSKSEDVKLVDQREEELQSHGIVCDDNQNADDTKANKAESPKETVPPEVFSSVGDYDDTRAREAESPKENVPPEVFSSVGDYDDAMASEAESPKENVSPEVFSSEGESTQEGEGTDDDDDEDDNGNKRSEKYTGESEMSCAALGSSVDRQSLEDIRMEDASDKSPKKGKGKNKEDCVVS